MQRDWAMHVQTSTWLNFSGASSCPPQPTVSTIIQIFALSTIHYAGHKFPRLTKIEARALLKEINRNIPET
jgi:hypothetical protein